MKRRTRGRTLTCCAISGVVALLLSMTPRCTQAQSREVESAKIYRALFNTLFIDGNETPGSIVLQDSLIGRPGFHGQRGVLPSHKSVIDTSLIQDFDSVSLRPAPFPGGLAYRIPLIHHSWAQHQSMEVLGRTVSGPVNPKGFKELPYWIGFAAKYSTAWGLTRLTRVGFNATKTQALVVAGHECGSGCNSWETDFLTKKHGRWIVAERMCNSCNESLPSQPALRYRGPDARMLALHRNQMAANKKAVDDSIALSITPRRLHAIVYDSVGGKPVPFARVGVYNPRVGPPPKETRKTDALGRIHFKSLAIGPTTFALFCPADTKFPGRAFGSDGFYVHAGMDTARRLHGTGLLPCWYTRKLHRIQAGELENTPASLQRADERDEKIFATVLDVLFPGIVGQSSGLVFTSTYSRCNELRPCQGINSAYLSRMAIVDSTTITHFQSAARKISSAIPASGDSYRFGFITPGEIAYLKNDGARQWFFDPGAESFGKAVKQFYPGAESIVSFTRPGYNSAFDEAMVEVSKYDLDSGGPQEVLVLRRINDRWVVTRRNVGFETVSAELSGDACVPAAPPSAPSQEDLGRVRGPFLFTLVPDFGGGEIRNMRILFRDKPATNLATFEVQDAKTGARLPGVEPGTYIGAMNGKFPSASNIVQLDGSGIAITIRRITPDALFGQWSASSFGYPVDKDGGIEPYPGGHFCARRVPT